MFVVVNIPIEGLSPTLKFYEGTTQRGNGAGYAATETAPMYYRVDVTTDLDAYTELRIVTSDPPGHWWMTVAAGTVIARDAEIAIETAEEIAVEVEAAIFNEADATALMAAIAAKVEEFLINDGDAAATLAAIAAAVRVELATELARMDTTVSSRASQTSVNTVLAKLLAYVQLLARGDAAIATDNAEELAEINADKGSGAGDYDNAEESLEAGAGAVGDATEAKQDQILAAIGEIEINPIVNPTVVFEDEPDGGCRNQLFGKTDAPVTHSLLVYETDGVTEKNVEGLDLVFQLKTLDDETQLAKVENADIAKSGNVLTFTVPRLGLTPNDAGQQAWSVTYTSTGAVLTDGDYFIVYSPQPKPA